MTVMPRFRLKHAGALSTLRAPDRRRVTVRTRTTMLMLMTILSSQAANAAPAAVRPKCDVLPPVTSADAIGSAIDRGGFAEPTVAFLRGTATLTASSQKQLAELARL